MFSGKIFLADFASLSAPGDLRVTVTLSPPMTASASLPHFAHLTTTRLPSSPSSSFPPHTGQFTYYTLRLLYRMYV